MTGVHVQHVRLNVQPIDIRPFHIQHSTFNMRIAFRMSVYPDHVDEYERRHRPIWPELRAVLAEHGVRHYSIFHDAETNDLFAYAEVDSEERWRAVAQTEACRRWWQSMRDLMPSNADASPVSRDLREVFRFDS